MAVWGLVSGIVGLFLCGIVLGPLGIVLGVMSRRRIEAEGGSGEGIAVAAIVVGAVVTLLYVVLVIVVATNPDLLESLDNG